MASVTGSLTKLGMSSCGKTCSRPALIQTHWAITCWDMQNVQICKGDYLTNITLYTVKLIVNIINLRHKLS